MNFPKSNTTPEDLITLFERTPDLVCIAGKDGYFKDINPAVPKTLGYTREELFARRIFDFVHPDDLELSKNRRADLFKGEELVNFQNRYISKTGDVVWLEWTSVYLSEKEVVFAIAKNVTARKQMEQEVEEKYRKFRQLAFHYKTNLEEDRKYVAAELHDELAQLASAVRIEVDWISSNVSDVPENTKSRMKHALVLADLLVDTIRRISFSISPAMLDDLGLDAALEWYCKEFSLINGIDCTFTSDYDESALSREVRLDFFRICQEALANIKEQQHASEVHINIVQQNKKVILSIIDNGTAFNPAQHAKSTGLLTMRERAATINASFAIEHRPNEGTRVIVEHSV